MASGPGRNRRLESGVTYWDTAHNYAGGNSEIGIGKFLEKNPGVPDIAFHRIGQVLQRLILAGRQVNKKLHSFFPASLRGTCLVFFFYPCFRYGRGFWPQFFTAA